MRAPLTLSVRLFMKLQLSELNEQNLRHLGNEATRLVLQRDFQELAKRFSYALAFGKDQAEAIEEDIQRALALPVTSDSRPNSDVVVKYFEPNTANLYAVVECWVPFTNENLILAELVVTKAGEEAWVTLEEISCPGAIYS
jgi:hypothetical protein